MRRVSDARGSGLDILETGTGPSLVFLHGNEGMQGSEAFLDSLGRSFHVVAPDLPGFGKSELPRWMNRVDDFAYPVMDLIERSGLNDIVLVGVSLGSWVASEIAVRSCERLKSLVLISPVGIKVGPRDELDMPDLFAMSVEDSHRIMFANPEYASRDFGVMSDEQLTAIAQARETVALTTWEPYMYNPKLRHLLHRIIVPTLVLSGSDDAFTSARYTQSFAGLIPNATSATIAAAGHFAHIEQTVAVAEAIANFVALDNQPRKRKVS